ncbi:MAG: outer membrane lipoprotein carrier protein LolA [Candidatus Marinimicrobia bacterium]|nr:outer membrane lipoprotein carrier protein LolA [Candidatus Neomarinimicrobiota bacterium]
MKKYFLFLLLISLSADLLHAQDISVLDTISSNYMSQIPFQMEYKIIQNFKGSDIVQEDIGQFYLHSKEVFRVNYPSSQILFDGTWLWSIDKLNYQIVVEEFDPSSSLRLIYNVLNGNMSEYKIQSIDAITDTNLKKIDLKSLDENSFFQNMIVTIDPTVKEIREVEYVDFQGTSIIITFLEYYKHQIDDKVLFEVKNIKQEDFIDLRP